MKLRATKTLKRCNKGRKHLKVLLYIFLLSDEFKRYAFATSCYITSKLRMCLDKTISPMFNFSDACGFIVVMFYSNISLCNKYITLMAIRQYFCTHYLSTKQE